MTVADEPLIEDEAEGEQAEHARFSITSYGADYPVELLAARVERGDFYTPPFQRDYVWSLPDASRFIESLLLGLPVPSVFLFREPDSGKHLIIDGQQRLKTLQYFLSGQFRDKGPFRLQEVSAAALPKPNARPLLWPQNLLVRKRTRRLMHFTPDKPEDWRVCFRCFPSDRRLPAGRDFDADRTLAVDARRRLEAGGPSRFRSAWPLAERFEALIRVFNAPDRYAERLARRLYAKATGLAALFRAPPNARHRIDRYAALERLCNRAAARFNSS